jgi:exoribonuclease-2
MRLEEEPFRGLYNLAQAYEARRLANGAISIELPEVRIRVVQGEVLLRPLPPLRSRSLVENAMIMAGEAVARFAIEHNIPLPFAMQEPPEDLTGLSRPVRSSEMFALRRALKRSQYRSTPAPHSGLGLSAYAQATSPLRRYLDLVVHQQLRSHLHGKSPLGMQEVLDRIGATEAVIGSVRQVEQLSNRHWTHVYLRWHPRWRGEGILVDKHAASGKFLIPQLALEVQAHLPTDLPLDSTVTLILSGVDLPRLDARFRVER